MRVCVYVCEILITEEEANNFKEIDTGLFWSGERAGIVEITYI